MQAQGQHYKTNIATLERVQRKGAPRFCLLLLIVLGTTFNRKRLIKYLRLSDGYSGVKIDDDTANMMDVISREQLHRCESKSIVSQIRRPDRTRSSYGSIPSKPQRHFSVFFLPTDQWTREWKFPYRQYR